ncbi:MAG: hypothetical protein IKA63_00890 [Clostridia bacterium]|nr:hypothetical protein [Clostridia bacterium]
MDNNEYTSSPDTALYIVTAGRSPSWPERERWQKTMHGSRSLVWILALILTLFFAYDAVVTAVTSLGSSPSWWMVLELLAILLVAVGGTVWLCFFPMMYNHRLRNELQTQWYDSQADRKRLEAGYTIGFYGDRVVHTDVRGATVLYYPQITACVETADGIALSSETVYILVRAQDLTAQQLLYIREHLRERLAPSVFRIKAVPLAYLQEPLPVMPFQNDDAVIAHGTIALPRRGTLYRQRLRTVTVNFLIPAMLVYGAALTAYLPVTGSKLLDLLIFCGGMLAGACLLVRGLTLFGKKRTRCELAFTREGLASYRDGVTGFSVWERVRVTLLKKGVYLQFFDGTHLTVPWKTIDQPDAVREHFTNTTL